MQKLNSEKIILVTGASRSGKSEFAEVLAQKSALAITYIATAKIDMEDAEWQERILKHQQRRPENWQTATISNAELSSYILQASESQCLLIDSLGTWIANFLDLKQSKWEKITSNLLIDLEASKAKIIFVGEETGW